MPASANQALRPSGTTNSGGAAGLRGRAPCTLAVVEMVVVVVRDQHQRRCAAARPAPGPAARARFGPTKRHGDARSENIGSVSTLRPPNCTSTLAWPIQVTAGSIAAPASALRAHEREVGRDARRRRLRRRRQAVAQRVELPPQQRAEPARRELDVVVLEAAVAVVRRAAAAVAAARRRRGPRALHERRHAGRAARARAANRRHAACGVEASAIDCDCRPRVWVRRSRRVCTYNLGLCRKSPCRALPPTR